MIEENSVDKPLLIRANMGLKKAVGHPDYPIKLCIAIPVEEHNDVVMKIKSRIEDILDAVLLEKGDGALVAIITGLKDPKFIEFLSYTKRGGIDFPKLHQELREKFKKYEVQMFADNDPTWTAYKSFAHL